MWYTAQVSCCTCIKRRQNSIHGSVSWPGVLQELEDLLVRLDGHVQREAAGRAEAERKLAELMTAEARLQLQLGQTEVAQNQHQQHLVQVRVVMVRGHRGHGCYKCAASSNRTFTVRLKNMDAH